MSVFFLPIPQKITVTPWPPIKPLLISGPKIWRAYALWWNQLAQGPVVNFTWCVCVFHKRSSPQIAGNLWCATLRKPFRYQTGPWKGCGKEEGTCKPPYILNSPYVINFFLLLRQTFLPDVVWGFFLCARPLNENKTVLINRPPLSSAKRNSVHFGFVCITWVAYE